MTSGKNVFVILLLTAFMGLTTNRAEAGKELTIPKSNPPKIDGILDDATWKNSTKIDKLYFLENAKSSGNTITYLAHDDKWLYLGFECKNPNMVHLTQAVTTHDGNICKDDSLEIFIKPEEKSPRHFHFMLNFANVTGERSGTDKGQSVVWNAPWRSMTKRYSGSWTAEIAIPLFVFETKDLSGMKINIGRNFMNVELDSMGALLAEKIIYQSIKPESSKSYRDYSNFVPAGGLGGFEPQIPFAPKIGSANVSGYRLKDGNIVYGMKVTILNETSVPGKAMIKVFEEINKINKLKLTKRLNVKGAVDLPLEIPADNFDNRKIKVVLMDGNGGMIDSKPADSSNLNIFRKAFAGRSYYTDEKSAIIRIETGLPEKIAAKAVVVLELDGQKIKEINDIKRVMEYEIPLQLLKSGDNPLEVKIVFKGKNLASRKVNLKKLKPYPGHEVKCDYISKILLKDGKPFFPVGIYSWRINSSDAGSFEFLSKGLGFNTIGRFGRCKVEAPGSFKDVKAFMELAEKYNLQVVNWNFERDPTRPIKGKPFAQRLKIRQERYKKITPALVEEAKTLLASPSLLLHHNVDEPNLTNPKIRIAVAEWYHKTVSKIDPYHPFMLLYSAHIPTGNSWTRWADILDYDIYPKLFKPNAGIRLHPGLATAYYLYQLRKRCEKDNKLMFFTPISNQQNVASTPIGMDKIRMLCQAYVSLIYDVKGIIYFAVEDISGQNCLDALKTINTQIQLMSPYLLNRKIEQEIIYPKDSFHPEEQKFPMVNAAVFKNPKGEYLLLAANVMSFAVNTSFTVNGLKKAELFFPKTSSFSVNGKTFTDKLEPYGVRAYKLDIVPAGKVKVTLSMKEDKSIKAKSVNLAAIISRTKNSKNRCPNPCFKDQFIKNVPNFYRQMITTLDPRIGLKGSSWFIDNENLWNGIPSLKMSGHKSRSITMGSCYPPASGKPVRVTFSCYAKGKSNKDVLYLSFSRTAKKPGDNKYARKTFRLTPEWKRYSFSFNVFPAPHWNSGARMYFIGTGNDESTVWINGLQLEKGEKSTKFEDNSLPGKIDKNDLPGNLVKNGNAEYGRLQPWELSPGAPKSDYISQDVQSGKFAFCVKKPIYYLTSNLFPVNPAKSYELSGYFKANGGTPPLVFGLFLYDKNKRRINQCNIRVLKNTETELSAPCKRGDKILRVKNASRWHKKGCCAAFEPGKGLPSFRVTDRILNIRKADSDWIIELQKPCASSHPAGVKVAEHGIGGPCGIFPASGSFTEKWNLKKKIITSAMLKRWPGTEYASVAILPKLPKNGKTKILFDDIICKELKDSQN